MSKSNVTKFIKAIGGAVSKRSPEILMGFGIAGMIATTIQAVKATPEAMELLERAKDKKGEELTTVETVQAAWKPYVPAAITCAISVGCFIGSSSVSAKRTAALTTAYQLSTTALDEYKKKVAETVGEEKVAEIREKIVNEKKEEIAKTSPTIVLAGDDDVLMFEHISNQEFKSTTNKVEKAMIELNKKLTCGSEYCISLNEFLGELGLKKSSIGDTIGWTASNIIDLTFEVELNDNGKPRLKIVYLTPPEHGYRDYY